MRGSIQYDQLLYQYSYEDRSLMYEIIKDNIEATKTSGLPLI